MSAGDAWTGATRGQLDGFHSAGDLLLLALYVLINKGSDVVVHIALPLLLQLGNNFCIIDFMEFKFECFGIGFSGSVNLLPLLLPIFLIGLQILLVKLRSANSNNGGNGYTVLLCQGRI